VTGKVQVNSGVSQQILLPNEKAIVDHSSGVFGTDYSETANEMAWHTKTLDFNNAPLKSVIQDLEAFYKVKITVENQELYNCLFASTFENEDLSVVFESLKAVLGVTVNEKEKGKFVLTGGGCQ
jgi:ferric-dicitrate binding protein FerR (iron transport regulator)